MATMTPSALPPSLTARRLRVFAGVIALQLAFGSAAPAQSQDAGAILMATTRYVSGLTALSATFDSDVEVLTADLEKIQFSSSGDVQLARPNKFSAHRRGGYADVSIYFDGKAATIVRDDAGSYARQPLSGSIDDLIDTLRDKLGVALPGADLLSSNAYEAISADVLEAKYIGHGVIDGVDCHHLAFRNSETDWQLWVQIGDRPIPRKYVITSKVVTGAPQYTLRIKTWQEQAAPDAFVAKLAAGAQEKKLEELTEIDDVPPGVAREGARK
jgi:hypothetical protein